jgi:hypothetical protein
MFDQMLELLLAGLFEWDFCPGNVLDDGRQIRLFDFGYMYRFDPLTEHNSNGLEAPLFHGAERFETRNYFAYLLGLERTSGMAAALAAFRLEKELALATYRQLLATLVARGAAAAVRDRLRTIVERWEVALRRDLGALYLSEGWRSHRLDLDDDLRGRTCTTATLARTDWLIAAARAHHHELRTLGALFWDDARLPADGLLRALEVARAQAQQWQVPATPGLVAPG